MKKTILSMSIGCLLLVGCSSENVDIQVEQQKSELFNVYRMDGDNLIQQTISLDEIKSKQSSLRINSNRGNSVHVHGDFHGLGGTLSFSGTQNNGGAHGSAEIEISGGGGPFGPPGIAHIILETKSVVMVDLSGEYGAVYGGIVSEVIENTIPGPPGSSRFSLGSYVYFLVKDNGEGNNAPVDQYRSFLLGSSEELEEGGALFPWDLFFFSWNDVGDESDKIKVNY